MSESSPKFSEVVQNSAFNSEIGVMAEADTTRASGDEDGVGAYAFLFDSSAEGVPEPALSFFTAKVLNALAAADPDGSTHSQLRVGLPMLTEFATRTTAVHGSERSAGRTQSYDIDVYKYVVWDWLDSLSKGWSTVVPEKGEAVFRLHTGECVTLTALAPGIRDDIDRHLGTTPGYVGAFEIDPGNPVHRTGFADLLIYAAAITNGSIIQDRSIEGDEEWPVEGADKFRPGGLVWQPYGWLAQHGPKGLQARGLSARGERAARAVARKRTSTIEERVIEAIDEAFRLDPSRKSFDFKAVGEQADILQAIMPEGKFTKYLFNREHDEGGPKAAFFIDYLGIEPDDWRYLAAQFYQGLLLAEPDNLEFREWESGYGMRFNVQMLIRGRTGVQAVIRTGWMMRPGALPSLSSAMPGDRDSAAVEAGDPPVLRPGARTDEDWRTLWEWANAAGIRALETVVPTPMYLVGYPPIAEGEMGSAVVRVADARRGFARWLLREGPGEQDHLSGTVVSSPRSVISRERAVAWARTVALILKLNGIDGKVETYSS